MTTLKAFFVDLTKGYAPRSQNSSQGSQDDPLDLTQAEGSQEDPIELSDTEDTEEYYEDQEVAAEHDEHPRHLPSFADPEKFKAFCEENGFNPLSPSGEGVEEFILAQQEQVAVEHDEHHQEQQEVDCPIFAPSQGESFAEACPLYPVTGEPLEQEQQQEVAPEQQATPVSAPQEVSKDAPLRARRRSIAPINHFRPRRLFPDHPTRVRVQVKRFGYE